ncbi:MAG TPA: MBL fold metallo-hydrolase [Firmicutes bacterium]|nr:MBL fold metallo-hydrolase [Bacillota bacterium]
MEIVVLPVGPLQANCCLLSDEEKNTVVVDPGGDAGRILEEIRRRGLLVQAVLLTHVHFDHMLAAGEIQAASGAPLWVPQGDEAALADPSRSLLAELPAQNRLALRADRLVRDGEILHVGGLQLEVLATPGHTPGSSCYRCENVLLTGDTLFKGGVGRTDFPGGDSCALSRSLRRLANLQGDYTVVPGHGPATTLAAERQSNPYMALL